MTIGPSTDLSDVDLRLPQYRREVFQRFYSFHLRYAAHPGCVYALLPGLRDAESWTREQTAWAALLNGHTQNPVTTWLLMRVAPTPDDAPAAVDFVTRNYARLAWDTDRRYSKAKFVDAIPASLAAIDGPLAEWWAEPTSFPELWDRLSALPTFGRLSTWSCAEYGWLLDLHPHDASTFLLDDPGSRSHRLGTLWVRGYESFDPHPSNPNRGPSGEFPPGLMATLDDFLERELLPEAIERNPGLPASRLTMESALCTYKSWHRPRRRYSGVYVDMAHDRIRAAEKAWPEVDFGVFWRLREDLPEWLRLESTPGDPGVVPIKQDWYRTTGRTPVLDRMFPDLESGWTEAVESGRYASLRRVA